MANRFLLSAAAALVLVAGGNESIAAQDLEPYTTVEGITEYRLENGLRVLLFPDASQPQTTVNITYFVGSRHEAYGETGMAHLLEHLVFKGTPDHPDIPQELTEHGAMPNGTTWLDRTNYFETFPASSENLEWALDLEADRMVNSFISAEDLESEMTVVRNEWEAGENSPFGVLNKRMTSLAYLWHNYGNSTIGARSDLENVPIDRLKNFYQRYYQPDNAMLVVAGQFDEAEALRLIQEKFGAIPTPDRSGVLKIFPTYTREPAQDGERTVTLRRAGDGQFVAHIYHLPAAAHPDYPAADLLAYILGDEPSGRLYKDLVEPGIAAQIGARSQGNREPGILTTYALVRDDGSIGEAASAMSGAMERVLTSPITGEEVERAKAARLAGVERLFNNSRAIALQLSEWAAMGDWRLFFVHRDRLKDVTAEDVQRVALSYLKPSNRTVGMFIPDDNPDRAEIPEAPPISTLVDEYVGSEAVAQGEAFDPSPENVDSRTATETLPAGLKVAYLPKDTRGETVVATLVLRHGDEESLMGLSSAGGLVGSMLMRGTTQRSRQEIEDEMNRLQAQVSVSGSATSSMARVQATRENFVPALRLLGEILREPAFSEEEFLLLKEQRLASFELQKSEPQMQAILTLQRHLDPRPEDHPNYVATMDESIERLNKVSVDQVRSFYDTFWGAHSATMAIVGDFDQAEVEAVVGEILGGWESDVAFTRIPTEYQELDAEDITIETPDKANAFFVAALTMPLSDTHEDGPALVLANYILGGGFLNSRLATRIRQEEGLSYGVGSQISLHPIDERSQFLGFAIYAPENAEALEAAFREELQMMVDEGFTSEELQAAKQGYLEFANLQRAQDPALAGTLSSNLYFGRTMEWYANQESAIADLTLDEINSAVKRWFDPAKVTVVKAGDFEKAKKVIP